MRLTESHESFTAPSLHPAIAIAILAFAGGSLCAEDLISDIPEASLQQPPKEAATSTSGMACIQLKKGHGNVSPGTRDFVEVHYSGWTIDGRLFDSSINRGNPATFSVGGVIKGWTEILQTMVEGEKCKVWIPANLAYGEKPGGGRPAGPLVFEIELLKIKPGGELPVPPRDLKSPPADAKKSPSAIRWKALSEGEGNTRPAASDRVLVHYSIWTTEGELFDTTSLRVDPTRFDVADLHPAWREALLSMVVGERRLLWIPGSGNSPAGKKPDTPRGPIVVDLSLEKIDTNP